MADDGEKQQGQTITVDQAAVLLGRSRRWVYNLVQGGYIEKASTGKYTVVAVVRGAVAYFDDQIAKNQKTAAASRATDARTREIELRIKERSRELIPLEDARAELADWSSAVRAEFQGLPARYTRDMKERRSLEQEIDGAFERLSRRTSEAEQALAAGEGAVSAEPET
ncbi:hypothetical protein [Roseovarius sp. SYSU LYC5161]|uniref:hypothetical protein n=1 Tax=Roseovarius halophilus (ex Wu et al. 2025) TaxID=3376060 RepID=UPI00399C426D